MPFGFTGKDVRRIGEAVRDFERSPARRPVAQSNSPMITPGTVVAVEIVSGPDVDGNYQVKILRRLPDDTFEPLSDVEFLLLDLNA